MIVFKNQGKTNTSFASSDSYESEGFNFKSTDINAALGLSQLRYIEKKEKKNLNKYTDITKKILLSMIILK